MESRLFEPQRRTWESQASLCFPRPASSLRLFCAHSRSLHRLSSVLQPAFHTDVQSYKSPQRRISVRPPNLPSLRIISIPVPIDNGLHHSSGGGRLASFAARTRFVRGPSGRGMPGLLAGLGSVSPPVAFMRGFSANAADLGRERGLRPPAAARGEMGRRPESGRRGDIAPALNAGSVVIEYRVDVSSFHTGRAVAGRAVSGREPSRGALATSSYRCSPSRSGCVGPRALSGRARMTRPSIGPPRSIRD
jgi:hypothetical protein